MTVWIRWSYYYTNEWSVVVPEMIRLGAFHNIAPCDFLFALDRNRIDYYCGSNYRLQMAKQYGSRCDICADNVQHFIRISVLTCPNTASEEFTKLGSTICDNCLNNNINARTRTVIVALVRLRAGLIDDVFMCILRQITYVN